MKVSDLTVMERKLILMKVQVTVKLRNNLKN